MATTKFLHEEVYKNGLGKFKPNGALQYRLMNAVPTNANLNTAIVAAAVQLKDPDVTLSSDGAGGWQVSIPTQTLTATVASAAGTTLYIVLTDHNTANDIKVLMYTQETTAPAIAIGASLIVPAFSFGFSAPV
jgi:hypothetical protein